MAQPINPPAKSDMTWPLALSFAFAVLIAWNATFIYLAVSNADPVDPSYELEPR